MPDFIVLTVDHNEQRGFVDLAEAAGHDAALGTALAYRDYSCHPVAYTAAELREVADRSRVSPTHFFEEVL